MSDDATVQRADVKAAPPNTGVQTPLLGAVTVSTSDRVVNVPAGAILVTIEYPDGRCLTVSPRPEAAGDQKAVAGKGRRQIVELQD